MLEGREKKRVNKRRVFFCPSPSRSCFTLVLCSRLSPFFHRGSEVRLAFFSISSAAVLCLSLSLSPGATRGYERDARESRAKASLAFLPMISMVVIRRRRLWFSLFSLSNTHTHQLHPLLFTFTTGIDLSLARV